MKVVSLFDGMSVGYQALKGLGVTIDEYHAFENDKYALQVAKKNHPDIVHHGEINLFTDFKQFKNVNLLLAGSPCQGFSYAGKQLNFNDPRSQLFFEFVRALKEIKPKYFMLENVKMKKEWENIISSYVGVEPILINAAKVSAQNRERLFWCNWGIEQPEDKGILLKDIIERGVVDRDKSFCIDANYWKGGNLKTYFEKHRRQLIFDKCECVGSLNRKGHERDNRVYSENGKSPTILAHSGGNKEVKVFSRVLATSERGRRLAPCGTKRDDRNGAVVRGYEVRPDGKTCALTTVQKDVLVTEDYVIRKLTPIECERLQSLPDNYTEGVSNTQRYKMLGNGWNLAVIKHNFKELMRCLKT